MHAPASNPSQDPVTGSHAIVVGGSLSGLLAGRVLSDRFDRVTILERDRYPADAVARAGIPQSPHAHALLARGLRIVERLLPGFRDEMVAEGAAPLEGGRDLAWLTPAGWGVACDTGFELLSFSRPLLDAVVRSRVMAIPNVRVLEGRDVTGLVAGPGGSRVAGVTVRRRGEPGVVDAVLGADLVVDASGRGSRAPDWLTALGFPRPEELVVDAKIGYASRFYRRERGHRTWKAIFVQAAPPERTRAGLLFPVEGDRWLVTLVGGGGDFPPTDPAGFEAFAASLASPILSDAIAHATPLSSPAGHRNTENRLRLYDRAARAPEGFVALGDAACAFNPVYGQGMTIAAMEAEALEAALATWRGAPRGFARDVRRRVAAIAALPWGLATGEDCRYRNVTGAKLGLAGRLRQAYVDRVLRLTTFDPRVRALWIEVFNMLKPPTRLFRPRIVVRVLRDLIAPRRPKVAMVRRLQSPLSRRNRTSKRGTAS